MFIGKLRSIVLSGSRMFSKNFVLNVKISSKAKDWPPALDYSSAPRSVRSKHHNETLLILGKCFPIFSYNIERVKASWSVMVSFEIILNC